MEPETYAIFFLSVFIASHHTHITVSLFHLIQTAYIWTERAAVISTFFCAWKRVYRDCVAPSISAVYVRASPKLLSVHGNFTWCPSCLTGAPFRVGVLPNLLSIAATDSSGSQLFIGV